MQDELLFDKRLLDRHIAQGLVTAEQVEARIAELPDTLVGAAGFNSRLASVGVVDVIRKKTGETDDD